MTECIADFKEIATLEDKYSQLFSGHPMFEITYEQITETHQSVLVQLQEFLGVNPEALSCPTLKMGTDHLHGVIENYANFSAEIANTPCGIYLE